MRCTVSRRKQTATTTTTATAANQTGRRPIIKHAFPHLPLFRPFGPQATPSPLGTRQEAANGIPPPLPLGQFFSFSTSTPLTLSPVQIRMQRLRLVCLDWSPAGPGCCEFPWEGRRVTVLAARTQKLYLLPLSSLCLYLLRTIVQ